MCIYSFLPVVNCLDVQSRAAILEELTACVTEVETRARQAEEARDGYC
ncbi:hypothetical protein Hanom_Chr03g00194521 [Helianthus anomalus]